jgi:hypothetical protein
MALLIHTSALSQADRWQIFEELEDEFLKAGVASGAIHRITSGNAHEKSSVLDAVAILGVALKSIDTVIGVIKLVMERRKLKAEMLAGAKKLDLSAQAESDLRIADQ